VINRPAFLIPPYLPRKHAFPANPNMFEFIR